MDGCSLRMRQQLSFPLKFYSSDSIAKRICTEKEEGFSTHEIARKYGYSESRVRQILSQGKTRQVSKNEN